ncbi:MAG TPA: ABC transporter permease subunit [Candidatus Sulfotelmatobacter sp.]|nr:ABC transporter permease subunit [Candidatus Sulfotelmatobacter sp.]
MTLFRQFFSAHLKALLVWVAVTVLTGLSGTRAAGSFIDTGMWQSFPKSMMAMYGGNIEGFSPVDLYMTVLIGKATPLIPTMYAVLLALSIITREVDRRTVEFLLALPVQRAQVLVSRLAVMTLNVSLVVLAFWAVLRFDMAAQGYVGSWSHLGMTMFNLWLLSMAMGAVTLAASMWIDDYSLGVKLFLGIVILSFVVGLAMRAAGVSPALQVITPFSLMDIGGVMHSGVIAAGNWITLVVAIVGGAAVSFWALNRKQFSA